MQAGSNLCVLLALATFSSMLLQCSLGLAPSTPSPPRTWSRRAWAGYEMTEWRRTSARPLRSVVILRVLLDKGLLRGWQFLGWKDRVGWAYRDAGAAVDTFRWVNIELRSAGEIGFVFRRMNAGDWASLNAVLVLGAGVGDDLCHEKSSPRNKLQAPCQEHAATTSFLFMYL